jgi:hypothetical protein
VCVRSPIVRVACQHSCLPPYIEGSVHYLSKRLADNNMSQCRSTGCDTAAPDNFQGRA